MSKLVCGIALNDADYVVQPQIDGVQVTCNYYSVWHSMIKRCYSKKVHIERPTYIGCEVSSSWLKFSNFKRWMETQDWKSKHLDKDIIIKDNKVYSEETCAFVDSLTNAFVTDRANRRGDWPIGVHMKKQTGRFNARCRNHFTNKEEHLGYFECPIKAHNAWRIRKHELACQIANLQNDARVAAALRTRYI